MENNENLNSNFEHEENLGTMLSIYNTINSNFMNEEESLQNYNNYNDNDDEDDNNENNQKFNTANRNKILNYIFQKDMKEILLKCGCMVYFIIGITLPIVSVSQELDLNQQNGQVCLKIFISLLITCYIFNCIFIIYNHYISQKMRDKPLKIKDSLLIYIVIIPLMSMTFIFLVFKTVTVIVFFFTFTFIVLHLFYFLFLISVLILLLDISRMTEKELNENKYINKACIILSIIGLLSSMFWWLTNLGIMNFKRFSTAYFNVTYYNNITTKDRNGLNITSAYIYSIENYKLLEAVYTFLFPSNITLLTVCIIILLESLLKLFSKRRENTYFNEIVQQRRNHLQIPFRAVFIGVVMIIMPIGSIVITKNNAVYGLIYSIIPCMIYCLGIVLSFIQIIEIQTWEAKKNCGYLSRDKLLLWAGYFGQIIFVITKLSVSIENIKVRNITELEDKLKMSADVLVLMNLVFLVIQITLQSVIVYLTLKRIYKVPKEQSLAKKYCPSMGLFCLNLGCLFIILYDALMKKNNNFTSFKFNLFNNCFHTIGNSLSLISRLHGCIFFGIFFSEILE